MLNTLTLLTLNANTIMSTIMMICLILILLLAAQVLAPMNTTITTPITSTTITNMFKDSNLTPLSSVMQDKIQGLSIQVGELYAQLYRDPSITPEIVDDALEAYKSLRRLLPTEFDGRHEGHGEAYNSTNGDTLQYRSYNS